MPGKKEKLPLSVTHPDLAKEACGWDPGLVTSGTGKKLSWKCSIGHTWETTPSHRLRGQGCPFCGNRKLLIGFNDLKTTHPEIAEQADGWNPVDVMAGSRSSMAWKCKLGHKWTVAVQYRTTGGKTGCPVCAGKVVHPGFNDLKSKHPQIASEAYGWDPRLVSASSGKKLNWKCSANHIYEAAVYSRTGMNGNGCPFCSNRKLIVGENDLTTTHPAIAFEAHGWDPETVSAGAGRKKYDWKCKNGHVYQSFVYSRTSGVGCPVCSNLSIIKGVNDLATTHPELSIEAAGWDTTEVVAGSSQKVEWVCKRGHAFKASIANRAKKDTGCPVCSNREVLLNFNDLATTHPDLASQAFGWDPSKETSGTHKKLDWKCSKGHVWAAVVTSRVRGSNCPVCSNQITRPGINDLQTTHPEIASQAFGWDPSDINAGSHVKKNWVCSKGHIWDAPVFTRMRGKGQGCPFCSNHRLLKGFNDLATTNPELLSEVSGWDASEFLSGARIKMPWVCAAGHSWETSISSRTGTKKSGCPSCAKYGYDFNSKGFIYLLEHEKWEMLQIGITNVPDIRLGKHKRNKWNVIELRGPMDGHLAQQWETAILRMLKAKGADLSNSEIAGKFDGYSEAWSKSTIEVKSIKALMEMVDRWETNGK